MHDQIPKQSHITVVEPAKYNSLNRPREAETLLMACFFGAVMGFVFIGIQPLFGMDTLTSRHAAAYQQLGGWGSAAAISIAWAAHIAVSVCYGLLCGLVVLRTARLDVVLFATIVLAWLTTIVAPPANVIIVQFVSSRDIQLSQLPDFNFSLDVKFVLHLVFFAVISVALFRYMKKT